MDFSVLADYIIKLKESGKRDKYLVLGKELKKCIEYEVDGDTNYNWHTWNNLQRIGKGTGRLGNQRTSGDYPNYRIIKISQIMEKSIGDLMRLTISLAPERRHLLALV